MLQKGFLLKQGGGLEGELKEVKEGIETSLPGGRLQTCLPRQGYHSGFCQQGCPPTQFTCEESLPLLFMVKSGSDFPLRLSQESSCWEIPGTFL